MSKVLEFPGPRTTTAPTVTEAPGFYTPADAARIARVPLHRLSAWKREGILFPTLSAEDLEGKEAQGYTFEAVVYLRLLRMLREQAIPLAKAVEAVRHLRDRFGPPGPAWQWARVFTQGRDVFVHAADDWDVTVPTRGGQKAATALFGEEFAQFRDRADALLVPRQFRPVVEIDPTIRSGLPVVRGTTMQTAVLYALRRRGESLRSIQSAYPHLTLPQIKGAVAFEKFLDAEAA